MGVTGPEARVLLDLLEEPLDPRAVRPAYLRLLPATTIDRDPDGFALRRAAFELLDPGADDGEVAAARAELAVQPGSAAARWSLLACLRYRDGADVVPILLEGAQRDPGEFLDELLFHFPERAPGELLEAARSDATPRRLLLIADAHAVQARPPEALEAYRAALAADDAPPRLAVRPVLSMQARGQVEAAREALAMLKKQVGPPVADPRKLDAGLTRILAIADELDRVGATLPLDLRPVAAKSGASGDFEAAQNEARFATRLWRARDTKQLGARLRREAPMLAGTFGLDLPLGKPGSPETRDFRIPLRWFWPLVLVLALYTARFVQIKRRSQDIDDVLKSALEDMIAQTKDDIERACVDPNSERCNYYRKIMTNDRRVDGGPDAPTTNSGAR